MSYINRGGYGGRGDRSYGRGGSGGYGRSPIAEGLKPVEVGKEYDVEITELSRRGDGLAKVQGFVVFVRGSKAGEKVKIKIETVGPRFATATVVAPSEPRVEEKS
jgi:predicted RNA-binding protein with TRAM domain